ncbi:MAG TPA: TetR/AcrR family transcriptional regulator [Phycisphaerae bacterium]|nr:TetR/AcrR family transcriptional regulator [Phycisphaerae bacterium]
MASPGRDNTRRRSRQDSTRRILDAAAGVFAADGPKAATIDAICAKAGLNKRMVYHYFGSKCGLYEAVLRGVYEEFFSLEVSLGSMLLPAEELLETLVRRYYTFLAAHPRFVRLIGHENLNDGRAARRLKLTGQKAPVITALELALRKGQAEGRFRPGVDATQLLISIFSLCFFYFSNRHTMEQLLGRSSMAPSRMPQRIGHVVDLLLHGIAAEGPEARPREKAK